MKKFIFVVFVLTLNGYLKSAETEAEFELRMIALEKINNLFVMIRTTSIFDNILKSECQNVISLINKLKATNSDPKKIKFLEDSLMELAFAIESKK
jgi:hypothetical protein